MLCSAGVYPIMGQDIYIPSAPLLERTVFSLANGALPIEAPGAGPGRYVQSVRVNDELVRRLWVRHPEIRGAARIEIELGDQPNGFGAEEPPPSDAATGRVGM